MKDCPFTCQRQAGKILAEHCKSAGLVLHVLQAVEEADLLTRAFENYKHNFRVRGLEACSLLASPQS